MPPSSRPLDTADEAAAVAAAVDDGEDVAAILRVKRLVVALKKGIKIFYEALYHPRMGQLFNKL